eukprot:365607-Chlamydomonas_euryale.AAC.7
MVTVSNQRLANLLGAWCGSFLRASAPQRRGAAGQRSMQWQWHTKTSTQYVWRMCQPAINA